MKVMKELWKAMGYENLGLTSQNLRHQAARLEKMTSDTTLNSRERSAKALRGRDIAIFQTTAAIETTAIETTAKHADLLSCGNLHETVSDFNDEYNKELQCPGLPNEITIETDDHGENTKEQYLPKYSTIGIRE